MAWISRDINPGLKRIDDYLLEKHFSRKHGAGAYYGQR
ncbi:L-ribulose-5-phosphate 4-epimerase UlaF [Serratia marcescens]|nr:L-ribulose-5-phosphate 4-epimerase UlaF [Serratia marcescens]CAH3829866.1 L-ribulose-5-phosphate 4-epimerase UlaF [Serratia marcescens]